MVEPLFITPVFKERVWGGTRLRDWFPALVPAGTFGECWAISGLAGHAGTVRAGDRDLGIGLDEAWRNGMVTGSPRDDDLPIMCKLLDPADWLSVQVHPNDTQALALDGEPRGKIECWYVVEAVPGAEVVIGHTARSDAELARIAHTGAWAEALVRWPARAGDFFMVPAGAVHAVGPGLLVYEVQQSSDLTYRLYDFDRPGLDGRPRELHLDKGLRVASAPYDLSKTVTAEDMTAVGEARIRPLVHGDVFSVTEVVLGRLDIDTDEHFALLTVVEGAGRLSDGAAEYPLARGTSVVLPVGFTGWIDGPAVAILTLPAV